MVGTLDLNFIKEVGCWPSTTNDLKRMLYNEIERIFIIITKYTIKNSLITKWWIRNPVLKLKFLYVRFAKLYKSS